MRLIRVGDISLIGRSASSNRFTVDVKAVMCFFTFAWLAGNCIANPTSRPHTKPPAFSTHAERCIIPASDHHQVNYQLLRAILVVESGLKPGTVSRNSNNTIDVGIAGINSVHFRELSKFGIGPNDLLDECVSTYVAAWKLKKAIARHGNTWHGIATYHSKTPHLNERYQILLQNELVRSGQMRGQIRPVPPISRALADTSSDYPGNRTASATSGNNLIFDERFEK